MTTTLDIQRDKLYLRCSDMHTETAKKVPGMSYDRKREAWIAPLSALTIDIVWAAFNGNVEDNPDVAAYVTKASTDYKVLQKIKDGEYREAFSLRFPEVVKDLWPLQIDGVLHLVTAQHAYLCDDMGAGKTAQCYRAMDYLDRREAGDPYPALVVANKSALVSAWVDESVRWSESADSVVVVDGTAGQRKKQLVDAQERIASGEKVVVVIGWGALTSHTKLDSYGNVGMTDKEKEPKELNAIEFRTVIADEVHKAKTWRSNRTRALWAVAHAPSVEYRWGLTGTPVTGYEEDVWGIGHTIQPTVYPRKTQWLDYFVSISRMPGRDYPVVNGFALENYDTMIRHLDPYMLRRTKAEIIPDYQGKLPIRTIDVDMSAKQRKAYKQMEEHMLTRGEDGILAAPNPITQLLRMNQFAAATPVIGFGNEGEMTVTGLTMPSCKVDTLLELLEELGDAQAVVFAESRLLIDLVSEQLSKEKVSYMRITGGESGPIRAANIEVFQRGSVRVALCTYGAGAESITLNSADTVIRLQRTYNFVLDTQAPDRVDRGSRSVPVQVIDLVTTGTSEHQVHARVEEKAEVFQQVVRDTLASTAEVR